MNLSEVDFLIIKYSLQHKSLTSTKLAKIIYSPKNVYELRKKDKLVRNIANKLFRYGILQRKIIGKVSYWDVGKSVFAGIPIFVDKRKVKFLGVVTKINDIYVIHGISE